MLDSQTISMVVKHGNDDLAIWLEWCEVNLGKPCTYPIPGKLNLTTNYSKRSWAVSYPDMYLYFISFWFADDNNRMQFALTFS